MSAVHPSPWPLPPEDRTSSPYTGWTRAHWEAVADGLLAAVRPYATPGRGLILLPGRHSSSGARSDGLEGFARTFLLAAFRTAGAGGDDPHGVLPQYADGLAAGTRTPGRDDAESWPLPSECGQAWVEAASIALGLRLTKPWLWDQLDDDVRQRAADWLSGALGEPPVNNNWWLFPLTIGGFLADAGVREEASRAAVQRGLERIEQWYVGGGWYTDGPQRSFDHYNGWALHLYPVLHAHLSGDDELSSRYGDRLSAFLEGYSRLFDADGAPLHQGRSLTYRFAASAALWAGALTGRSPLVPGATRRIASGSLRYFLDRGAAANGGLLSSGWHGPYEPIVQSYSGTASPYWASKGFVGLLLPPGHPEWAAVEQPSPAETADTVTALRGPGWLAQSTAADGLVRLHNHGSHGQILPPGHDDPLYARLAYSTRTGPTEPGAAADNHFGLLAEGPDGERKLTRRGAIRPLGSGPGWAASAHRPLVGEAELPDVEVTSVTLARGATEVRIHQVDGAAHGTAVRQSGWAADGAVLSELVPVRGFGTATAERVSAGRTAYAERTRMPVLNGSVGAACDGNSGGAGGLFVCLARLSGNGTEQEPLTADVRVGAEGVRIVWPQGDTQYVCFGRGAAGVTVTVEATEVS